MMWSNDLAFASRAARNSSRAGRSSLVSSVTAATCIAVGNLGSDIKLTKFFIKESKSCSRIITALAHINVIVRMNRFFRAQFSTKDLDSTVGNDLYHDIILNRKWFVIGMTCLVDVHVALGSRTGLEHNKGK